MVLLGVRVGVGLLSLLATSLKLFLALIWALGRGFRLVSLLQKKLCPLATNDPSLGYLSYFPIIASKDIFSSFSCLKEKKH